MTVFVYNETREKPTEPYLIKNSNIDVTNMSANEKERETGSVNTSKLFWIKVTGIYLLLFSLTICVIGTLGYGYRLTNRISNHCSCAIDSEGIILRIEELERRLNIYEKYVPINGEYDQQVINTFLMLMFPYLI